MYLETLLRDILADESEDGRKRSLEKVYREIERTKGYRKKILGRTVYGPVHFCEQEMPEHGKADILLLGGIHPFCEAATAVSVVHAMREKPDCNLCAIPVVSPWAFVAPVTNKRMLRHYEGDEEQRTKQYRQVNYHEDMDPLNYSKYYAGRGSTGDIGRLAKLEGRKFDIVVECHMDYDRDETFRRGFEPTHETEAIFFSGSAAELGKCLGKIPIQHYDMVCAAKIGEKRNAFLLREGGTTVCLETDPDDVTLLKRFVDTLIRTLATATS